MMKEYVRLLELSIAEMRHLFLILDADDSGTVSIAEFVYGCLKLRGPAKAFDLAKLTSDVFHFQNEMRESMDELVMTVSRVDKTVTRVELPINRLEDDSKRYEERLSQASKAS